MQLDAMSCHFEYATSSGVQLLQCRGLQLLASGGLQTPTAIPQCFDLDKFVWSRPLLLLSNLSNAKVIMTFYIKALVRT